MGKFEIVQTKTGHTFHLKAGNGEVVGTSQVYTSLEGCKHGVESVKHNAIKANLEDSTVVSFETQKNPKFEIYLDKGKKFRFHLKASNGEIILASQSYTAKESCKKGIASIRKNAPDALVFEVK